MMKKVQLLQLTRDIELNYDLNLLNEFNTKINKFKELVNNEDMRTINERINATSYITNLFSRNAAIATNVIENVIIEEDDVNMKRINRSLNTLLKHTTDVITVLSFVDYYSELNNNKLDFYNFKTEVKGLHKSIFDKVSDKNPGKFKTTNNCILNLKEFMDKSEVETELVKLGMYISVSDLDKIVIAAIAHAHFIGIHPFKDGNGRIGRLITDHIIEEGYGIGLYPDEAIQHNLPLYISALNKYHMEQNPNDMINFYLNMAIQQLHRNTMLFEEAIELAESMTKVIGEKYHELSLLLVSERAINVAQASKKINLDRITAKRKLDLLKEAGYLQTEEAGKMKVYSLRGIIKEYDR